MILAFFFWGISGWLAASGVVVLWDRSQKREAKERQHLTDIAIARHAGEVVALARSREPRPEPTEADIKRRSQPPRPIGM